MRRLALGAVVLATLPYLGLKLAWLAGSPVGVRDGAGALGESRYVVGNAVTLMLDLTALVLAVALTRGWAFRVPGWALFLLAGGATGLLAPILLGLPLGVALQGLLEGSVSSGGEGDLAGWVYGLAYGGFGLLALGLGLLLGLHAVQRWPGLLVRGPRPPRSVTATAVGGLGMLGFAAAMLWWSVAGPGSTGPAGMTSTAQRTVMVVIALLAVGGFVTPGMGPRSDRRPGAAWLMTWTGCAAVALQGPTMLLLAQDGRPAPFGAVLALVATPAALAYGLAVLRASGVDGQLTGPSGRIRRDAA